MSVHTLYAIPAFAGIQGVETDPGFQVVAWNENAANSWKEKNMDALLPCGTSSPVSTIPCKRGTFEKAH